MKVRDDVDRLSNLVPEKHSLGHFDKAAFIPHDQTTPCRCPFCNTLHNVAEWDFGFCPNCNADIRSKRLQRNMFIESQVVKANGGWNQAKLDALKHYNRPMVVNSENRVTREIDDVAERMTRAKVAEERLVKSLRDNATMRQTRFRPPRGLI